MDFEAEGRCYPTRIQKKGQAVQKQIYSAAF